MWMLIGVNSSDTDSNYQKQNTFNLKTVIYNLLLLFQIPYTTFK